MFKAQYHDESYRLTFDKDDILHVTDRSGKPSKDLDGFTLHRLTPDSEWETVGEITTGKTKLEGWQEGLAIQCKNHKYLKINKIESRRNKRKRRKS